MKIGIATDKDELNSLVSSRFNECGFLLIIGVKDHYAGEAAEITEIIPIKNEKCGSEIQLAEELVKHDCEAVITGELAPEVFEYIAESCITRYNGKGYPALAALEAMERHELKLIRNLEGTDECDGSHHNH